MSNCPSVSSYWQNEVCVVIDYADTQISHCLNLILFWKHFFDIFKKKNVFVREVSSWNRFSLFMLSFFNMLQLLC